MNLQIPITQMKEEGNWPLPWTSALGLVPVLQGLGRDLVGCEVGVSYGFNLVYFLENLPTITKVYAVDPYLPYDDGPGGLVTQDVIDKVKELFLLNIEPNKDRVKFVNLTSIEAVSYIPDHSLDYVFIDGDHSYKAVTLDIRIYFNKVKSGGIFSGHDFHLNDVRQAVHEFRDKLNITDELKVVENNTWYWVKS